MSRKTVAYAAPFGTFLILLACLSLVNQIPGVPKGLDPRFIIFPLQTVLCSGVLACFWPEYEMGSFRRVWIPLLAGVLVFWAWVTPQVLLAWPPRLDGFNPDLLAGQPAWYWGEVVLRFARLAVVVPLLEEIFWRGFLLRYFIQEDFTQVRVGTYGRKANIIVAVAFMLEHSQADWGAALLAGFAYNLVAFNTRSLWCCVLAHALTNALLGIFVMNTHQWGFW